MGRPTRRILDRVRAAVSRLAEFTSSGTAETLREFKAVEGTRTRIAEFIHSDPASILLVGNTTEALGIIATALPLTHGDNVLIADIEFMGAPIVWRGVCRRLGVELVPVPTREGKLFADDFAAQANSRTRAIVVSSVQEVSGWCANLQAIQDVAAKSNAFIIADGIQEIGTRPVDFSSQGVDAYCAGGHKWLRSPFGLGFACLSPRLLEILEPVYQGYLALAEPEVGWDRYMESPERTPFDLLPVRRDAERMQTGGYPNWLGAVALHAAVEEFESLGAACVWNRIQKLRTRLVKGLCDMGLEFLGGPEPPDEAISGIVTIRLPDGVLAEKKLLEELKRARVYASLRYVSGVGGIRVAVHESNTENDLDALLDVLQKFIRKRGGG